MSETCAQCRGTGAVKVVGLSETGFRQTVTAPCAACRPGADHPEPIVSNVARWDATSGPVAPPAERGAKPAEEQFGNLCDAMAETVANMTDEEVIEEARAEGLDPHAEAERLRTMVLGLVAPPPAPEPGEMSREEIVSFLSAVEDANIDADPRWLDNGTRAILAHDAALRARAKRERQRAEALDRQKSNVETALKLERQALGISRERLRRWETTREDQWAWEGGADAPPEANRLESLTCPVVIRPDVLMAIFRERDEAREQRAHWKEAADVAVEAGKILKIERDAARLALSEAHTSLAAEKRRADEAEASRDEVCLRTGVLPYVNGLRARLATAEAEVNELGARWREEDRRNCQVLGRALGYPEQPGGGDIVVGPNSIGSLCDEAADRMARLNARVEARLDAPAAGPGGKEE